MIAEREEFILMAVLENSGSNWRPILQTLHSWEHKFEVDILYSTLHRLEKKGYLELTCRGDGHEQKFWDVDPDGLNAINRAQRRRATVQASAGFAIC